MSSALRLKIKKTTTNSISGDLASHNTVTTGSTVITTHNNYYTTTINIYSDTIDEKLLEKLLPPSGAAQIDLDVLSDESRDGESCGDTENISSSSTEDSTITSRTTGPEEFVLHSHATETETTESASLPTEAAHRSAEKERHGDEKPSKRNLSWPRLPSMTTTQFESVKISLDIQRFWSTTRRGAKRPWIRREEILKKGDTVLKDGRGDDIIILVMGPIGAGKSTLINRFIGAKEMQVGCELGSCTSSLGLATMNITEEMHPGLEGRRVVFVDTPGFDDTYVDDLEILRRISAWLVASYDDGIFITGVIYLHEISRTRMLGTARKNLDMFRKLCGYKATENVVLVTTKWAQVTKEVGEERETQLRGSYWRSMMQEGATVIRFELDDDEGIDSSGDVLKAVLAKAENNDEMALRVQNELVELQKLIPETKAGQSPRYTLQGLLAMQKDMAEQLKRDAYNSGSGIQWQLNEQPSINRTHRQINELEVPIGRVLRSVLRI